MSKPTIYLARHATPDWSRTDIRYDMPPGPPLTAQGEAEAEKLGAFLAANRVTQIFASPLERTQCTAAIAAQSLNAMASIETVDAIAEWQHGEDETLVLARIHTFWEELAARSGNNGPVALVSHGGPIRLLLEKLSGDPERIGEYLPRFDHHNPLPPAGAWRAQRQDDGSWEVDLVFTH